MDDFDEIRNLIARYCQTVDSGDFEAWAETMTHDVVVLEDGVEISPRQRLVELTSNFKTRMMAESPSATSHLVMNSVISLEQDCAHASSDMMIVEARDGECRTVALGRYVDTIVRTEAGWRFARREISMFGLPPERLAAKHKASQESGFLIEGKSIHPIADPMRDDETVYAKVSLLDAQRGVTETLHRYAFAIDRRLKGEWLDCFAEDGVFEGAGTPADLTSGAQILQGRDALGAFFDSRPTTPVRHAVGNVQVEVFGLTATARSSVVSYTLGGGAPELRSVGDYHDELTRGAADGRWRFTTRRYLPADQ